MEVKAGQEVGIDAEAMEECLLLGSSWLAQFTFLLTQNHLPRESISYSGLDPSIPIINQENYSQANLVGIFSF